MPNIVLTLFNATALLTPLFYREVSTLNLDLANPELEKDREYSKYYKLEPGVLRELWLILTRRVVELQPRPPHPVGLSDTGRSCPAGRCCSRGSSRLDVRPETGSWPAWFHSGQWTGWLSAQRSQMLGPHQYCHSPHRSNVCANCKPGLT